MKPTIVHCDLDAFFVSVERLLNSSLLGKPVLIGGNSQRSVVASCSYEARKLGVHSGMPMRLARQLCPEAILVHGDFDLYSKYSNVVTEIIEEKIPIVEKASIDEHYLDMTGMERFFGTWQLAKELRQRIIRETGLPISFGLASNKTVSKIATGEAKPSGEQKVDFGMEKPFLAPLSIRKIPGVGTKTYTLLRNMGVAQIATLQQMEVTAMRQVLGEKGVHIWKKASGIDKSPVVPFEEQKSMSKETTFEQDTIDIQLLRDVLLAMVDELAFELRQNRKLTGCVSVKIRYSNFDTHNRQAKLPFTSSERTIAEKALFLFDRLYSRRMLIRLIGVKITHLVSGSYQTDLFNDTVSELHLSQALDQIRQRYGFQAVMRGSTLKANKH
ncbi:MAG TPA: DNA polymerase IV [Flavobacteriaceae bacterium]|nr:DNA polymerase IV [Flavobacteriaceae bacterium]